MSHLSSHFEKIKRTRCSVRNHLHKDGLGSPLASLKVQLPACNIIMPTGTVVYVFTPFNGRLVEPDSGSTVRVQRSGITFNSIHRVSGWWFVGRGRVAEVCSAENKGKITFVCLSLI